MKRKRAKAAQAGLDTGRLTLEYDLNRGVFHIRDGRRPIVENAAWEVAAARTWRSTQAGPGRAERRPLDGGPLGPGEQLCVEHVPDGLGGRRIVFRAQSWSNAPDALALCVEFPLTPADAPLDDICPLVISPENNGLLHAPADEGEAPRMLTSGYQSWDHSTVLPLDEGVDRGSWFFTVLTGEAARRTVVLAQLTSTAAETLFGRHGTAAAGGRQSVQGGAIVDFCARSRLRVLRPAKPRLRSSEWIYIAVGDRALAALDLWADRFGLFNRLSFPAHVPAGYCTWYLFNRQINADIVRRNITAQAELLGPYGYRIFQVDDGATSWHGDWLDTHARMKGLTLSQMAALAKKHGLTPGLWLTPFLISERSRVFREHPDWFAKDAEGAPQPAANPWLDEKCYISDGTNPAARRWMAEQFRALRKDIGFDYFKLDFCFNATAARYLNDPDATAVEAFRAMMDAVRKGAGRRTFLLGCGAPLAASTGLFDAMRIGPDTGWTIDESHPERPLVSTWPQMSWALSNVAARACMHRRLWLNDPDCVMARAERNRLTLPERRTLASLMALSGGMVLASDDLPRLEPEGLALLRAIAPPTGEPGWCADLFSHSGAFPAVWVQPVSAAGEQWRIVALANTADEPRSLRLPFGEDTGLAPGRFYHLREFWSGRYWGAVCDSESFLVPPHDCLVFAVRGAVDHPWVIGTDRHITQGGVELPVLKLNERLRRISGRVRPLGAVKMTVWFYFPGGTWPAFYECPGSTGRLVRGDVAGLWGLELAFSEKDARNPQAQWPFTLGWAPAEEDEPSAGEPAPRRIRVTARSVSSATLVWDVPAGGMRPPAWRIDLYTGRRPTRAGQCLRALVAEPRAQLGGLRGGSAYTARVTALGAWGEPSATAPTITFTTRRPARSARLSDLPGLTVCSPGAILQRDCDFLLKPLQAGGRTFRKGVAVLAGEGLRAALPGPARRVSGWVIVPGSLGDMTPPALRLEIQAEGAAAPCYTSPRIEPGGPPVKFQAALGGSPAALIFRVRRDEPAAAMANWILADVKIT
ncbi:MAG: hypothetical protein Kow0059_05200 [Candidatus Sumerlaeia bacterium]